MKDKTITGLVRALKRADVSHAQTIQGGKQTIYSWIRKGLLNPRTKPHNGWYVFNNDEIAEIVKAFSPKGDGYWNHEESSASR